MSVLQRLMNDSNYPSQVLLDTLAYIHGSVWQTAIFPLSAVNSKNRVPMIKYFGAPRM